MIMETLVISPDFTVEDIHRIREQNYERTRDMTVEEKVAYYNNCGKEAEKEIEQRRALKRKAGMLPGKDICHIFHLQNLSIVLWYPSCVPARLPVKDN